MIASSHRPNALAFYRDLSMHLCSEHAAAESVATTVQHALEAQPLSLDEIEQLRQEAADQILSAPRRAWAAAYIAGQAAEAHHADALVAACALTLGTALAAVGEFSAAMQLLQRAAESFRAKAQPGRAARCDCELAALYTSMGKLDLAEAALARAQAPVAAAGDPVLSAYYDRAEGLFYYEKNLQPDAIAALRRAAAGFESAQQTGELAATWCALGEALRYIDWQEAQTWVEKARGLVVAGDQMLLHTRCDLVLALICDESNRYADSLKLCQRARAVFSQEGLAHHVALCDVQQGIAHFRLGQFDEALDSVMRARAVYAAQALDSHLNRCDLNLATIDYALGRYDDALVLYQKVAEAAMAEGRALRAARCCTNMGLCFDRLGQYDQALRQHERARQAFLAADRPVLAARCLEHLAATDRHFGRSAEALQRCQQAREVFAQHGLHADIAWCDSYLADLYLAMENYPEAVTCLERARAAYERSGMLMQVASCDRDWARALARTGELPQARELLRSARATFAAQGLDVEVALCDVALGELHVSGQAAAEAAPLFQAALAVLDPGFPDEAWRAEYGLGQCALIDDNRHNALDRWLRAVELTHRVRAALPTERLRGGYFADRRALYAETLQLAVELQQGEVALQVAEAGKDQTFLSWADQRSWLENAHDDAFLTQLLDREGRIRRQLTAWRDQLRVVQHDIGTPALREVDGAKRGQTQALEQLTRLARAYEDIVDQLRIRAPARLGAPLPQLFSVETFRAKAQQRLPPGWACLAYYLFDDQLVVFYLDAERLVPRIRRLDKYERRVLDQCTSLDGNVRSLIYGASHRAQLRRLYELLIPPEVAALGANDLLIVAPHTQLHALPFQALNGPDGPLVDRVNLVVAPSLGALETLWRDSAGEPALGQVLAVGLASFGEGVRPLPHAEAELAALQEVFGQRLKQLWGEQATRATLLRMQHTGELDRYQVLHFATHAWLDHLAPTQSSVLLHDDHLAYIDILNLKLHAHLVVLASCEGALGQRYAGDEMVGLAQAFFFAGARTVVASLWPVEDASTTAFMRRFYRHLDTGSGVARSLRAAQRELAGAGYAPYQWAPFVAIGLP
ncbi:MAG TPA: CHAT domain-containing tetratricopeptide repeat protein [Anaerolineae bacterium]|nr:CHAT domain-containing tetratricopeptide repeat protein [Anaerolineae bacterium]